MDKSVKCGCGVHLMDPEGKVPRRRVVKLDDEHKLHIICPHCHGATCVGIVGPPPLEEVKKSGRVRIVYYIPEKHL